MRDKMKPMASPIVLSNLDDSAQRVTSANTGYVRSLSTKTGLGMQSTSTPFSDVWPSDASTSPTIVSSTPTTMGGSLHRVMPGTPVSSRPPSCIPGTPAKNGMYHTG